MGILDGALRIMPSWEWNFRGHTITLSVLIPFVVPLTVILGGAALWPFFERWATGDKHPWRVPCPQAGAVSASASSPAR